MTEDEARRRAEQAAATYFQTDHLIGKLASLESVEVATRALLAYAKEQEQRWWGTPPREEGPVIHSKHKSRWA